MAPEVIRGRGLVTYTAKTDCWSLGVILYQLLSGHLPHCDGAQMTGPRWEEISDEAKDLVKKLIQIDPLKRLSAVQALQHIWFQGDDEACREARNIMFDNDTEDSLSLLEEVNQYDNQPEAQPGQSAEEEFEVEAGKEVGRRNLRPKKKINYKEFF